MGGPDRRAFIDLLNESPATGKSMPVLVFCSAFLHSLESYKVQKGTLCFEIF